MLTQYITIKSWTPVYKNPVLLSRGERVKTGREDDEWKGWIWCITKDNSGWVPKQIIKFISDTEGEILENYTAVELETGINEKITAIKEINGWIFGRHEITGKEGWLPKEILK